MSSQAQGDRSESRAATPDEIRRYEASEQHVWKCPTCDHGVTVLSALMVACAVCADERNVLRWMVRQEMP